MASTHTNLPQEIRTEILYNSRLNNSKMLRTVFP